MSNIIDRFKAVKNQKLDIAQLLKHKDYKRIYEKYGPKVYRSVIPPKIKKAEINALLKQGRYEDIYIKFGKKVYNSYLIQMRKNDVQTETGSKYKGSLEEFKYWLKIKFAPILLSTGLLFSSSMPVLISATAQSIKRENEIEYSKELEEYNEHIKEYAKEIQSLNLTDTQIFVKLMYDLWRNIDGYKTPEKYDQIGIERLSVEYEKVGVCRNFADDLVAKLNAINPEYNARTLNVYMSKSEYEYIDIERNELEILDDGENNINSFGKLLAETLVRKSCCSSC